MATATHIQEMKTLYQKLVGELVPVEAFFAMQLQSYLEKEIAGGRKEEILLSRDFNLLTVSDTHAIFIAYPETVFDKSSQQVVDCTLTKVSVPLVAMAREEAD